MKRRSVFALPLLLLARPVRAAEFIVLASTTSAQNSGLYAHILPIFEAETGIAVRVVAVGTGQALRIARNGDADVLIVHHRPSEEAFIAEGYGLSRQPFMQNGFVIVGPEEDPAGVADAPDAATALARIAEAGAPFASRGDNSGTHLREMEIWAANGVAPGGDWYLETGSGMGATLNFAAARGAYTLTDGGTWAGFGNRQGLAVLVKGDPILLNTYSVIEMNPDRFPALKRGAAHRFAAWLLSATGQQAIRDFRPNGVQAFCPIAPGEPPCSADD